MEDIFLKETKKTPLIHFKMNGELLMEGNSYPENPKEVYGPVITWLNQLKTGQVNFKIALHFFNSSTSKYLVKILQCLEDNKEIELADVHWHYYDEELHETGKTLAEMFNKCTFSLIKITP